jgi:hypothetical protein
MISGLLSVRSIGSDRVRGSEPMTSGEAISAHITNWLVDSSSVSSSVPSAMRRVGMR